MGTRMCCCTVKSCCCGCTLKTGVLIIGALYLAVAILGGLGSASKVNEYAEVLPHPYARVVMGLWVAFLVGCIGSAIANSLLIHGARTAKPGLIMPGVILTLDLFFMLVELIRLIYFLDSLAYFVGGLVFTLVGFVLAVYFSIVLRSYRKQLQENPSGDSAGKA